MFPRASRANSRSIGSRFNPDFTFASFVEGKSNQLARAAAVQVGENPGKAYNPLFIYGGVGLGKTHLMHAVGNLMRQRNPAARIAYVHSERFVSDMVRALQHNTIAEFKQAYRTLDALLIDDIQFFAGKDRSQEEFFHTFNALLEGQQQIILTCDRYPKEVTGLEERLKSRIGWGLTVAIEPPELETCVAILIGKAQAAGESPAGGSRFFHRQADPLQCPRTRGRAAPGARDVALHRPADHARVRARGAEGPAGAAGAARHDREHPEDRRRVLQDPRGGPAFQAPQPLDRPPAPGRDGARPRTDQSQPSGNRRRFRRPRSHDRACTPAIA